MNMKNKGGREARKPKKNVKAKGQTPPPANPSAGSGGSAATNAVHRSSSTR